MTRGCPREAEPARGADLLRRGEPGLAWEACSGEPAALARALLGSCSTTEAANRSKLRLLHRVGPSAPSAAIALARRIGSAMRSEALAASSGSRAARPFQRIAAAWFRCGADILDAVAEGMGASESGPAAQAMRSMALAQILPRPSGACRHEVAMLGRLPLSVPGLMEQLVAREAALGGGSDFQLLAGVAAHGGERAAEAALAIAEGMGMSAPSLLAQGWQCPPFPGSFDSMRMTSLGCAILWRDAPLAQRLAELGQGLGVADEALRLLRALSKSVPCAAPRALAAEAEQAIADLFAFGESVEIGSLSRSGPEGRPPMRAAL